MAALETVRGTETLRAGALEASFAPGAGMLGTSLTHDGEELLGPLGIPFLHPWANRLGGDAYTAAGRAVTVPAGTPRDEHGLPIHGVAPQPWIVSLRSPAAFEAVLDFDHPAFPFPHRVEQRVALTPWALRVETTLRASGGVGVPVAFGFHPYLTIPGAERADWLVSLPPRRRLVADERLIPTGERVAEPFARAPLGDRTFDDGYDGLLPRAAFAVEGAGRRVEVVLDEGYGCAQVVAPPTADVICFEPMTAPANALVTGDGLAVLPAGGVHRSSFSIRVVA